ncbi:MAG: T9SS type A sorting domain-containing protein, partial [Candidatus Aegiribacteria sp.]|nr:T9SS type A sorting domain-containing protein [Candidatus Aegiribacteria sp.]MBD3294647.1 T9SS type A sorting domain-containing protein [Candidatus Fermentibacteria bacterium]
AQTFHAEGTTNASGEVTINIDAPASGIVYIGACKQNYYYDTAEVIIGVGVAGSSSQTPVLSLDRPSPNPVLRNASIGFSVPGSGNVELSVYDVSGRMVETVYSGTVESGNHSVEWAPGTDIGSGVYFLRLSTESGTLTQQAMVIK